MMTHEEFISIVKQPEQVTAEHAADMKGLVDAYPYFAPARLFHAKALQKSNSVLFGANLKLSSVYASNRRWLYYYIYPERKISSGPYRREKSTKSSGDYFDLMNVVESRGGDAKQSLRNLAERLKSARTLVSPSLLEGKSAPVAKRNDEKNVEALPVWTEEVKGIDKMTAVEVNLVSDVDYLEDNAKKLIREHKYVEAIEILKVLNLNNPKKSVYFADQIRFLEKIIVNSKNK